MLCLILTIFLVLQEIQAGSIRCDLRSVSIGNGWISPLDFNLQYSSMLYQLVRTYVVIETCALFHATQNTTDKYSLKIQLYQLMSFTGRINTQKYKMEVLKVLYLYY